MGDCLRPADLARAVGISAQTVRKYEKWGFLPPAQRLPTGYRCYGPRHLEALQASRTMIAGYTWVVSLRIMRHLHAGDLAAALALADGRHARLHQEREALAGTLQALRLVAESPAESVRPQGPPGRRTLLQIGEVAQQVGVRVSAVRFWEEQGLVQPHRDPSSGYRVYDPEQMLRVQVVALLRRAGYGVEEMQPILAELAAGRPDQALAAAERRLTALNEASHRCMAATAALYGYITNR